MLVSFDGSPFLIVSSFFFFPLLQDVWECFAGQSSKRGTFLLEFLQSFLFFHPQDTQRLCFSLFVFGIFFAPVFLLWYCKGRDRSSCGILPHSAYYDFCFHFPFCQVPAQNGSPRVSLLTHFDTKPFWSFLTWD